MRAFVFSYFIDQTNQILRIIWCFSDRAS